MAKRSSKPKKRRKQRGNNKFADTVLSVFESNPKRVFNHKQVSAQLGIRDKASKDLVQKILIELLDTEALEEVKPGKFKLSKAFSKEEKFRKYITGTVDMKSTGKAYVLNDEGGEDIYIAPNNTYHALNGDKVKVFLFPLRKGRKIEGQIIEIIHRAKENYVGILDVSKNFAFLIPDNKAMPYDIFIHKEKLKGGKTGQKAIARITDWPEHSKNPFGEVTAVLGQPGDNQVEMQSILAEFDFPLQFPAPAEKEAEGIPAEIRPSEIKDRKDYRDVLTITIDPSDAKDYDDALSFKKLGNGRYEIGVHIADVSHYVKPGSAIDKEAFNRATSVYLVDRVIPMLPEKLSNNLCSLRPDEDKLCFSVTFEMDDNAMVHKHWIGRTIIRSNRRFDYDEVQSILDNGKGEYSNELLTFNKLAQVLREDRFRKGSINFETQEVRFNLDEEGKPVSVYIKEYKESNQLIEEFMLLANRTVAKDFSTWKGRKKPKTFVYRVHDTPNMEKLETFSAFLKKLGYNLNINNRKRLANSLNNLFEKIEGKGEQNMIEAIAIRTMAKAVYSTVNIGHYGLGFEHYTHFTSPIRRYPDLMVHRLVERYLDNGQSVSQEQYESMCEHASDMERKAIEAERDSIKYKQAEFMMDKIGQEFEGLISGVSKWGIYVELKESKAEGMVRLSDLKDDFYYLDEENYQVIGNRYGQQYKLGDDVLVRVKRIDLSRKEMDFEMLD
jgi:ribonuclease R